MIKASGLEKNLNSSFSCHTLLTEARYFLALATNFVTLTLSNRTSEVETLLARRNIPDKDDRTGLSKSPEACFVLVKQSFNRNSTGGEQGLAAQCSDTLA